MQIPQVLPTRRVDLVTNEADALAAAQPERRREYVRLRAGHFSGALVERSDGIVALAQEQWSAAVRVRCGRPRSYVVFSAVTSAESSTWCGIPLEPRSVIELNRDWEIGTHGALEAISFAVERGALERVEALLAGDGVVTRGENRLLEGAFANAEKLRDRIASALLAGDLPAQAQRALQADLLYLAARLRAPADPRIPRLASASARRRAVRRIEEYLDVHEREVPSLAELCAVAGTSERTLEYAFREQIGLPPARYLRLRRLNGVRRELRASEAGAAKITQIAMRWGFWQLGRFAVEYRTLFGERPSETLSRSPKL